ncbi:Hydrogenase 2 maturation protease [Hartmannibacter diazotrophicus]|uniref:Hydrogenase expression/formation protein HupD n=1 Tax=Hartmannibacter diazotrophicus TaxID=1482074 RepID=A0A2C9D0Q0_9HYPH|nr:HyaD/HybD family hydrogenase maturation endopeptidase [Hartmannibacter diazotrophicus]SON53957.1 Hydrogenase 2 maturation protease [Hartmannibacter diazotrophicus]
MDSDKTILVLGIGNLLWADEGFGVRAAEEFDRRYDCGEAVTVMDGGTQGVYLLPHIQDCRTLILFDAIDYGLAPGTLKVIEDGNVPAFMGAKKMSLHQTGFQEVLASALLLGWEPERILLIGVQPEEIEDYGGSLRPVVAAAMDGALAVAVAELERLGVTVRPRQAATVDTSGLGPSPLDRRAYEDGRPSEDEAFRKGDIRVLAMLGEG